MYTEALFEDEGGKPHPSLDSFMHPSCLEPVALSIRLKPLIIFPLTNPAFLNWYR